MSQKHLYGFSIAFVIAIFISGCSTGSSPLTPTGGSGLVDVTPQWLNLPMELIQISGNNLYMCGGVRGFHTFDISDGANPRWVNRVDIPADINYFTIKDGYAYLLGDWELFLVDIKPASSAHIVSQVEIGHDPSGIAVNGNYAFIACSNFGLEIIDCSDKKMPEVVSSLEISTGVTSVAVKDGYAYVTDRESGVHIVDVMYPESAFIVDTVETESRVRNIFISGEYAVLAYYRCDLQILDISQPAAPVIAGTLELPGDPRAICIKGEYIYVYSNHEWGG